MRLFCLSALFIVILAASFALPASAQPGGFGLSRAPRANPDWAAVNSALSIELSANDIGALAKRALSEPIPMDTAGWLRRLALLARAEYRQDTLEMLTSR